MDDLEKKEYINALCHSMDVLDYVTSMDSFTGSMNNTGEWVEVATNVECRVSGSPGRIKELTGRQATTQEVLIHTLFDGLQQGMRVIFSHAPYQNQTYEVALPYPAYDEGEFHHLEVVATLISESGRKEREI